jgi:pimeloyl-ACP methyl ester carboxylesterase
LRFDVAGIGDSQGSTGGRDERTFFDDTLDAMELLRQRIGADRFMLLGICMGAKIALEVARRDARVESLVLMEGIYVKSAKYYISRLLDPDKWKRLLAGESHMVKQLRNRIARRLGTKAGNGTPAAASKLGPVLLLPESGERDMGGTLQALLGRGVKILLVFRDGNEIAYNYRLRESGDDIYAVGLPEGLDVAFVRFADHTFTPLISQELLLAVTMRWIEGVHPVPAELPDAIAV